ncbi:MAG TPA: hypothetical protein PLB52_01425 [Candidatus Moranbacteria bacterium]|nr:hypothetical protein [Candidatus Moranbacteria bacterium]
METTETGAVGYLFWIIYIALTIYAIYYSKREAKELKMSETIAVVAGLLFPILALLIYAHLNYRAKRKESI